MNIGILFPTLGPTTYSRSSLLLQAGLPFSLALYLGQKRKARTIIKGHRAYH